jgi:hypothetical protein
MAQKKIVEVEIKENLDKVDKKIDNVVQSLTEVKQTADKVGDSLNKVEKEVNDISVAGGKASGALKRMGSAISDIGGNIKGIGLGALISQFDDFKDAISGSNKVVDFYNQSLNVTKKFAAQAGDVLFSGKFLETTGNAIKDLVLNPSETIAKATVAIKQAAKEGDEITKLKNNAMFAAVEQQGIFEKYDKQAEEQRLIRDNEFVSLPKRTEANRKLAGILAMQKTEMLAQADLQIKYAEAEAKNSNNQYEDDLKLREAKVNRLGIEAQLQGFITEQSQAEAGLQRERLTFLNSEQRFINENFAAEEQAQAALIKNDKLRLETEIRNLEYIQDREGEYLEKIKNQEFANTQARLDAEDAFTKKMIEVKLQLKAKEDELMTYNYQRDQELRQNVINNELEAFSTRLFALQKFNEEAQASTQISEDEKRRIQLETFQQERVLQNQRLAMISNTMGNISSLFDAASTEGKAFAVAQALINTYQGITAELATKTATPFEFGLKLANVAVTAAMGFKAVKDIISVQPSTSGGGMEMSGPSGGAAPQFNVVGTSGINQIAQTINAKDNQPIKAFVVASEVTSQQSLDRNKVSSASLG